MKILVGDKDSVDFDAPVRMSDAQKEKFIQFLKTMFPAAECEHTDKHRIQRMGDKIFFSKWRDKEYIPLFELASMDPYEVAEKLGRTWMAVVIKRGQFIPQFLSWAQNKGVDLLHADTKALIVEFLKEKEHLIIGRRATRRELRELKIRYESMNSGDGSKVRKIYENLGDKKNVAEFDRIKEELRKRIDALEKELE